MDPIKDGKEIEGFPAYRVTPDGQVWSRWKRANTLGHGRGYVVGEDYRQVKLGKHDFGYAQVNLRRGDKTICRRSVHKLLLEAFVGPCPPGMQCRHDDGNPKNNRLGNLFWGTPQQNQHDRKRHGTDLVGEKHPMAKLTEVQIEEIRKQGRCLDEIVPQHKLAIKFKVSQQTISNIIHGRHHRSYNLTKDQIEEIRQCGRRGTIQKELAKKYGVSQAHISKILKGQNWIPISLEVPKEM